MKSIKAVSEMAGRMVSIEEIKGSYNKYATKVDEINKQLKDIDDNGRRLSDAKQTLDIIDKYKDIAETYDNKILGKEKYQQEHQAEKWQYDNAKSKLKEYGIKDRNDLKYQEVIHKTKINVDHPKLKKEIVAIQPRLNMLYRALQAWNSASKEQGHRKQRSDSSYELNKYKNRDDLEQDR